MSDWQKRYQRLLFDRPHPKVLRVTMNRPDKYNATDTIMHTELVTVWRDIDADDTVNCVIIQGAGGKVFSAGGDFDLIEKNIKDYNALLRTWKEARDIVYNVINCSKPIVSTMRGPAVGAKHAVVRAKPLALQALNLEVDVLGEELVEVVGRDCGAPRRLARRAQLGREP